MVLKPMLVAVSDRGFARLEDHPDLGIRVARTVPPRQRVRTKWLPPFEFQQPAPGVRLSGLGRLALELGDAGNGHGREVAKSGLRIKFGFMCASKVVVLDRPSFRSARGGTHDIQNRQHAAVGGIDDRSHGLQ